MISFDLRTDELFLRNEFQSQDCWGIPLVKKQLIDTDNISLISCSNTRKQEDEFNIHRGVHFFVDDRRFENIYNHPERSLEKYSQYDFLLTPDFSVYSDMPYWRQLENVAKNRWVGAYWQSFGLTAIPTMSWSDEPSFSFCFTSVEHSAIIAVGMIGCKRNKRNFMYGYDAMLERIEPSAIICYGTPFSEMRGNLIVVEYQDARRWVM